MRFGLLLGTLLVVVATPALADVTLPPIFSDNMVIQRDAPFVIWGTSDPAEKVTVEFDHRTGTTTADNDGHWRIEMEPFLVTAQRELVVRAKNTITLKGVCVGDVWVCSGQSNMAWPVSRSMNAKQEIATSENFRLRLFTMHNRVSAEPQTDFAPKQRGWSRCDPTTVGSFSAVAYYFGRVVREDLGIPVGLIVTAWGGTPAESWTRREELLAHDECQPIVERWDKVVADYPAALAKHKLAVKAWEDRKIGRRPRKPPGPLHPHRASGLWNGMVQPLTPMCIKGFLWYQGESNVGRAEQYGTLFPAMIRNWRASWDQGDLPFLFVQLANFRPVQREPVQSAWAELRDAQRRTLSLPKTAMAVTIDIGEAGDIHPKNKQEVGRRLALAARALAYPKEMESKIEGPLVYSGPLCVQIDYIEDKAHLSFMHLGRGGLQTRNNDPLRGFTIAGKDKVFRLAHARIQNNQVILSHPDIGKVAAVRYGWADNPVCNLVNAEGLPASPFRSDTWPGLTAGKR